MIYKIELSDITNVEIEACSSDKVINLHLAQGYEKEKGDIEYSKFMNTSLDEKKCIDLINALNLALKDLRDIE